MQRERAGQSTFDFEAHSNWISHQGRNQIKLSGSTRTEAYEKPPLGTVYAKTQNDITHKAEESSLNRSAQTRKISGKKDVNATIEYSLNNSGFTNYKPEEVAYYKQKQLEMMKAKSPKGNASEGGKEIKLSKVEESNAESASNVKFVDFTGFEGEVVIQENCVVEPRKTYDKRYGKTIIKSSNIIDQKDLDMEIKKSVIERVQNDTFIDEDRKVMAGSYVKTHYRKLGGSQKKAPKEVIKEVITREVKIQELADVSQMDISFDHLGNSKTRRELMYDAEGREIDQGEQILSSVYMMKSGLNTGRDMGIQNNPGMLRELRKSENPQNLEVVSCYKQESAVFKKKADAHVQVDLRQESFTETAIVEDYKNAVVDLYLDLESQKTDGEMNNLKENFFGKLVEYLEEDEGFIRANEEQLVDELNREIIRYHTSPSYREKRLVDSQASMVTFGKKEWERDRRSMSKGERMNAIIRYATQLSREGNEKLQVSHSLKQQLISNPNLDAKRKWKDLDEARKLSMYIRNNLQDAPQIKLHMGSQDLKNQAESLTEQSRSYAHSREKSLADMQKMKEKKNQEREQQSQGKVENEIRQIPENFEGAEESQLYSYMETVKESRGPEVREQGGEPEQEKEESVQVVERIEYIEQSNEGVRQETRRIQTGGYRHQQTREVHETIDMQKDEDTLVEDTEQKKIDSRIIERREEERVEVHERVLENEEEKPQIHRNLTDKNEEKSEVNEQVIKTVEIRQDARSNGQVAEDIHVETEVELQSNKRESQQAHRELVEQEEQRIVSQNQRERSEHAPAGDERRIEYNQNVYQTDQVEDAVDSYLNKYYEDQPFPTEEVHRQTTQPVRRVQTTQAKIGQNYVRIYTEQSNEPHQRNSGAYSNSRARLDQVSEQGSVRSGVVRHDGPKVVSRSRSRRRGYHTTDERQETRRVVTNQINRSYTNAGPRQVADQSFTSTGLNRSIQSMNPRVHQSGQPQVRAQQHFNNNNFQSEQSFNFAQTHNERRQTQPGQEQGALYDTIENQHHTYSKKTIEPMTYDQQESVRQEGKYVTGESFNTGRMVDEYYGEVKESIDVDYATRNFTKKGLKIDANRQEERQEEETPRIQPMGQFQENQSQVSGTYQTVRSSYARQFDGETRNRSSVVRESTEVKVTRKSVKEQPVSTREISKKVYEEITEGASLEPSRVDRPGEITYTRTVPKIKEKIVEKPYTVYREKPVPNYIYKDVVTEKVVEIKKDRIIENEVEEIVHKEVENVIEQEKITEIVQEVEKVNEKFVQREVASGQVDSEGRQVEVEEIGEARVEEVQDLERSESKGAQPRVEFDEEQLERVSVNEHEGVEYRTYYVKVPQDKVVDVEEIEYKNVDKPVEVQKTIERVVYKDVPVEHVKVVEVDEEEVIIEKKDRVVDVYKDTEEIIKKTVQVPKVRKVQIFKDVEVEREVIEEVPVEVFRDKEVIQEVFVEIPREVEVEKEVQKDIFENTEKAEYIQKVIQTEREFEVNVTKMKPKYKEIPINTYKDVEVTVNEYLPIEEIRTVSKKKDVVVPKIVEKIIQVPKITETIVEKEVEQIRYVPVIIERDVIKKKEVPVIVEKLVEVPVKKFVHREVIKEVEKPVEIEIIEENPILIENEVEEIVKLDVRSKSLRENLLLKNEERQKLEDEAIELKRELRKSYNRIAEKRKSKKQYAYLGKDENQNLRKELTKLHREYRNVVKENTNKQLQEMQNAEIVKVIDRKKMDDLTVQELKKSGVIREGQPLEPTPLTPGVNVSSNARDEVVLMNPETERMMNETIKTYQTIGSYGQLSRGHSGNQAMAYQNMETRQMKKITSAIKHQPTNPQSLHSNQTQGLYSDRDSRPKQVYVPQPSLQHLEGDNVSRTSNKRSIKLTGYKSKNVETITKEKSVQSFGRVQSERVGGLSYSSKNTSSQLNYKRVSTAPYNLKQRFGN